MDKPLYRIRVKSLNHPDGVESLRCRKCCDHASYIADSQGPRWYIRGNPVEYVADLVRTGSFRVPVAETTGDCEFCEHTDLASDRIIARIEGVPVSAVTASRKGNR